MARARLFLAVLASCGIVAFYPADAPHQQQKGRVPIFQAQTELVLVPVIAHRDGKHAGGLGKGDFTVLADGKPQTIAVFEEVHASAPAKVIQTEEFTNRASGASGSSRPEKLTIIAIDLANTAPLDQAYLKQELLRFLESAARENEPFGLVAITSSGIRVMHDFTTDPRLLAAVVKQQPLMQGAREAPGGTVLDFTPCARSVAGCGGGSNIEGGMRQLDVWNTMMTNQERLEIFRDRSGRIDTLAALIQLAQSLHGLPGRKTLVWVSSGIQTFGGMNRKFAGIKDARGGATTNFAGITEAMDQSAYAILQLNLANIAVYPLDAHHGSNPSFENFEPKYSDAPLTEAIDATRAANKEIIDTFQQMAADTGGKPCFNRTDLANCLKEAAEDSKDYYLLGFYPDKQIKPGWHSISMKLNGPKTELRYRNGFLAAALDPESSKLTDLQLAIMSPLNSSAVPFRGRFESSTEKDGKRLVGFALDLPPEALMLNEDSRRLVLDVVVVVRAAGGKEVTRLAQRIDRELAEEQAAIIRTQGIHYTNRLELPTGEYGVWFIVRDSIRGRTGSVVTTVIVR